MIADDGAPLTTDRDHRVRIRFPWLRAPALNAFAEPAGSDRSQVTAWVRVATASAGPNWGAHHLPRAGTQALLTFVDGDIDRPLVTMQLHNEQDALPWPAADAPLGQALSGWHSPGLGGDGYNQWVVDDHPAQLRMRLASSTAGSQLNLGYVVSHGPTGGERGDWRGTGAELRTDAWAVVRAGSGLLLSTTVRAQAGGTLLDMHEARGQLTAAQRTAQRLSDAAASQQALPLSANAAFDPLTQALDPAQDGHYPSSVNGQDAVQPNRAPVDKFAQPLLVTESPASIALASQATTTVYAGRHLHGTAQGDWHLAAGNVVAAAAARGVSLFAQRNGLRAIAEGGPVSIQAHTDALAVLADQAVTVISSTESIEILAQRNIVLRGGDSVIRMEGSAITFETIKLSVKGAGHPLIGPGGQPAELPALPTGATDLKHWIEINHRDMAGEPFAGQKYKIHFENGQVISGKLDAMGHARHENVPPRATRVEYEMPKPGSDEPWEQIAKLIQASRSKLG
ncbi:type VI secretion system tip protein VgrG [Ralstonia solanacearum]|nr:type VI secretion system tip protein VgrG [Ralstonia solanacearum]NKA36294.1 type VI secretion system tip protein VgrG [Ralstonia solanacearum]NKA91330.1 type VI secretion system tip protein VgrG [Ralstonia solanacearum]NKA96508.1 type VI secretion system tip protein VgrG [Ralstonia solanacearum]NKB15312.1 type VI secretion system tip protein VgrG [Ralstonia solanacearum]